MRVLVTGASGFAGSLLVPRLLSAGHQLRTLARDPSSVTFDVEVVRGDAVTGEGLASALIDVDVAYYLIHSMESVPGEPSPFPARDRIAAETFAAAAADAGVGRIVYLGGLTGQDFRLEPPSGGRRRRDSPSRHLESRAAVEEILMDAVPDSISLRASIVIGAHSRSFRLLVHLVERLPVLTLPSWRLHRTQPIDGRDVTDMLVACAAAPLGGRRLDIGGPDVLTYGEIVCRIADLMLVRRPSVGLRLSAPALTARVAAAIAGEDPELVVALMESLDRDLLPAPDDAARLLGVHLHSFDSAVEHALAEWERSEPLAAR